MNTEIKERIDKIEEGIVPEGYKKTKIGMIPEDWEVKRLEEVSIINRENIKSSDENSYYYYDLSSINNGSITKPEELINYDELPSRAKRIFKKDDILLSTVRPNLKGFAHIDFKPINSICSTGFAVIESKINYDSEYIYNHLFTNNMENRIDSLTVGSNYPALNLSEVKNLQIPIPQFNEQEKIAKILSLWDKYIEITKKIIIEKEIQKKGFMQELLTGEIRLTGFNREWEKVKLGEVANIFDGVHQTPDYKKKGIPFVSVENIDNIHKTEKYISKEDYIKNYIDSKKKAEKNDIFMTRIGSIGVPHLIEEETDLAYYVTLALIKLNSDDINPKFLYYNIQSDSFQQELFRKTLHVAYPNKINLGEISLIKFEHPNLLEQEAIADILSTADKEIELLKQLLENKKEEKKGLMQLLLTGIVRV